MLPPQRFALLSSTRYLLPVALLCALGLTLLGTGTVLRAGAVLAGALLVGLHLLSRRRRPILVIDDRGYAVEVAGQQRFFVPWTAVTRALHDPSEQALYLDCGDPARNLLLPPLAGFAFSFEHRDALYERLLSHIGDRIEVVPRLDAHLPPAPPPPPPPQPDPQRPPAK